jgi:hypothetical protein
MAKRDPQALAERLGKYADAITAFAVLETIAFFLSLGNSDFVTLLWVLAATIVSHWLFSFSV